MHLSIEVKASANPRPRDAGGLKLLRDRLGDRFRQGILFHLDANRLPLGERIAAVPLAGPWH